MRAARFSSPACCWARCGIGPGRLPFEPGDAGIVGKHDVGRKGRT